MTTQAPTLAQAAPPPHAVHAGRDRSTAASVETELTFIVDTGTRPRIYSAALTGGVPQPTAEYVRHRVPVADARPHAGRLSLDREGFELRRRPTAVADLHDEEAIRNVYYPEAERLVREATGAEEVLIFDHTLRVADPVAASERGVRTPVQVVHNDYTARSGPQRVRDLLDPEAAAARLAGRFAIVNVWRPIRGPVQTAPLTLADARSVAPGDLVPVDLVYPERVGEIYELAHNPAHRWFYLPEMTPDEALLIKGYDSAAERARFTPHAAFDDPTAPPDAPSRESIELRTLAFFPR